MSFTKRAIKEGTVINENMFNDRDVASNAEGSAEAIAGCKTGK